MSEYNILPGETEGHTSCAFTEAQAWKKRALEAEAELAEAKFQKQSYLDQSEETRLQLGEMKAERDRLKAALKRQLKTSVGFGFEARRLREALERIHSFAQSCDATPEALLLHIENAARNALAGGSERETPDPE